MMMNRNMSSSSPPYKAAALFLMIASFVILGQVRFLSNKSGGRSMSKTVDSSSLLMDQKAQRLAQRVEELEHKLDEHLLRSKATERQQNSPSTAKSDMQASRNNATTTRSAAAVLLAEQKKSRETVAPASSANVTTAKKLLSSFVPAGSKKPALIYAMHVPKTGGRSTMFTLTDWLINKRINCWVPGCCQRFPMYIDRFRTALNDSDHSFKTDVGAGQCRALSAEISVPGILKTKELLNRTDERWFVFSIFGNPLSRYVSMSRHHVREGRCNPRPYQPAHLAFALQTRLDGNCTLFEQDDENQADYYFKAPWNPNPPYWYFPKNITAPAYPWKEMQSNVDLFGLTHYMPESNCLLALELAAFDFLPVEKVSDICTGKNQKQNHVQSTKKGDPDLDPLTTAQVERILQEQVPLDVHVYPDVLLQFATKLEAAVPVLKQLLKPSSSGAFLKRLETVQEHLSQERQAWLKLRQSGTKLDQLSPAEQGWILTKLRWSSLEES